MDAVAGRFPDKLFNEMTQPRGQLFPQDKHPSGKMDRMKNSLRTL
jgi:hypothetical protein